MQQALLDQLRKITEEERKILDGEAEVDRDLYTSGRDFTVDSRKMLKEGRLIAVRTHTRFVYFPAHRHNFVEVLYVCEGSLTNIIDGKKVIVNKGELLFLNQFTKHEILKAGQNDIAINFMVLPEFFDVAYSMADVYKRQILSGRNFSRRSSMAMPVIRGIRTSQRMISGLYSLAISSPFTPSSA